ncbi:MAG: cation:proton antiporter [Bacteroidia bacterium]|nr:cation:proton antiporter [Bacteroidia bacterium]
MPEAPLIELGAIGLLFIGLFVLSWFLQRNRVPALLGFMVAGLLAQDLTPSLLAPIFPVIGEVAVWLLFFFVGLEYSPEHLGRMSRSIARPGLIDLGCNFGVITLAALWVSTPVEALLLGSALYPSSTAIVARLLLDYSRLASIEAELLLGLLIFEDIVGVTLLGLLTPLSQGQEMSWLSLLRIVGAFIGTGGVFWIVYRWGLPWLQRNLPSLPDEPSTVFLTLGLVLGVGAAGHAIGLSGALTAFLLGVLLPEESELYRVAERSLGPIRELSVGLFFFALSYTVQIERLPVQIGMEWFGLSLLLKGASTFWAARIWGLQPRTALRAALSFLPKGEFSLLFGALSILWREVILSVVLASSLFGTLIFSYAPKIAERIYPRKGI